MNQEDALYEIKRLSYVSCADRSTAQSLLDKIYEITKEALNRKNKC
jgi:hypothetical protein